jgi:translation initiation factor 1
MKHIVYSTNPDYMRALEEEAALEAQVETRPPAEQPLKIRRDNKQRKGKEVTLVDGFIGKIEDLETLGKWLKTKCGTGGSVKDGQILLQGDWVERVCSLLVEAGYLKTKK